MLFQVSDEEDIAFLLPTDPLSPYSKIIINFLSKIDEYDMIKRKEYRILYSNSPNFNFGCSNCFHKIYSVLEPTEYTPEIISSISALGDNYQYISLLSCAYYTFYNHKNEFKRHSVVTYYYEGSNEIESNFSKLYKNEGYVDDIITDEMYFVYYVAKYWLEVVKKAKFTKPKILERFSLKFYSTPEIKYRLTDEGNSVGKMFLLTIDNDNSEFRVDYSGEYVMNIDPRMFYPDPISFKEFNEKFLSLLSYTYEHILFVDYGDYCKISGQKIVNGMDAVVDNYNSFVYFLFYIYILLINY